MCAGAVMLIHKNDGQILLPLSLGQLKNQLLIRASRIRLRRLLATRNVKVGTPLYGETTETLL